MELSWSIGCGCWMNDSITVEAAYDTPASRRLLDFMINYQVQVIIDGNRYEYMYDMRLVQFPQDSA